MGGVTDDPNDPGIRSWHGPDEVPVPQNDKYLVLSEAERAKGFVRPVRTRYQHVGIAGPANPLRDLSKEEIGWWKDDIGPDRFVKFESYPPDSPRKGLGRFWTQKELDSVGKGCQGETQMGHALSETYAREPGFYGETYCAVCSMHRPVGKDGEFVWLGTDERVGT